MADAPFPYPPAPADVPADLTTPPASYRLRVVVVLLCLLVFAAVYLALTAGSAYACYACFAALSDDDPRPAAPTAPPPPQTRYGSRTSRTTTTARGSSAERKPVLWLVVGGLMSGLLCLFMVKGLFKGSKAAPGVRLEVTEAEQPELFAFIRRLCQDTRAPFPRHVYLVPDVNAAVAFDESVLNLVVPARKNLIIGLGLVNRLDLSEFKAVLAHEFGHFSQKSMALDSYVYTANRVVADVVYGRDRLDDMVAALGRTDIRIAVFAWGFAGVLWVMRKALAGLFRAINFANVSLSRQMEYNADLVAVSVTGSDPLIFALARLDFANETLGQAWADLTAAADHGRFTRDLYYHQAKAADYLRARRGDPTLGAVPPLPDDPGRTVRVFQPADTGVPKMWATHPSNHDREANAKRRYVRGPIDGRSAWELFRAQVGVRAAMTRLVYESARGAPPPAAEEPEAVQAFIDAEHAETTYHPRYHGVYEDRHVKPGDPDELFGRATWQDLDDPARLAAAHAGLYDGLPERMAAHKARHEEAGRLARLAHGAVALTGSDFEHRGRRYRLTDAGRLLKQVEDELGKDYEWMHLLDRAVFRVHAAMAARLGGPDRVELESRYRFHLAAQKLHAALAGHNRHAQATLAGLSGQRQVAAEEFQNALGALRQAHEVLRGVLDEAGQLPLPPLVNMKAGEPLAPFLFPQPLVRGLSPETKSLDGAWITAFFGQAGEVLDRLARVLFKSLGGILALQERIAEQWTAANVPAAEAATPGSG